MDSYMNTDDRLKSCPFCGSADSVAIGSFVTYSEVGAFRIRCYRCHVEMRPDVRYNYWGGESPDKAEEEAIEIWNRRA